MRQITINQFKIGESCPLTLIAGPCVIEEEKRTQMIARSIKDICNSLGINFIFKASFDKANRSSINSYRGPGLREGMKILNEIKKSLGVPVVTDIHLPEQAEPVAEVCDVLQIPAYLCRQTDLIVAAGETGRTIGIKKGQFMAPEQMHQVAEKIVSTGNKNLFFMERGSCFGYNTLISDMRAIVKMQNLGYPVCFDATHSVQQPGGAGATSSGEREFVEVLSKAALAVGAEALFLEVHDNPSEALSDGPNMVALNELEELLHKLLKIYVAVRG